MMCPTCDSGLGYVNYATCPTCGGFGYLCPDCGENPAECGHDILPELPLTPPPAGGQP